jgi:protein-S-isoprenylcysteine O-methyltransferase Ste14
MLAVGVMWVVKRAMPGLTFDLPGKWALAIAFALVGIAVAAFGVAQFVRAKTTVNPLKPGGVSALVTSGVYRFTRNPMYTGMLFFLAGVALAFSHLAAFAALPAFLIYMNRFQISPEEAALSRTFGPAYAAYRQRVRRWL